MGPKTEELAQKTKQPTPAQGPVQTSTQTAAETVNLDTKGIAEIGTGQSRRNFDMPNLANTAMVAQSSAISQRGMLSPSKTTRNSVIATQTRKNIPSSKNETRSFSIIRRSLKIQGISRQPRNIIINSWRNSTKRQYDVYIRKWIDYCGTAKNPIRPNLNDVLNFLSKLHTKGLSYSALSTARSAISVFVQICSNINIHDSEILSRFMKGCFNARPALPRYHSTWDVNIVLKYLHNLDTNTLLSLSYKLCMLFLLVTGQRCQTLHLTKVQDITVSSDRSSIDIVPSQLLKQSRPGKHLKPIILHKYNGKRNICVVNTLLEYMTRTEHLRVGEFLIITSQSPYKRASSATISRWIKKVLANSGVDTIFKPHSTRAASTSKAHSQGVALQNILDAAGWSNAKTFAKFYLKDAKELHSDKFQNAILADS